MLSSNDAERARQFSAAQAAMARDQDAAQAARAEATRANDSQRQARAALAEQRGYEEAIRAAQKTAGVAAQGVKNANRTMLLDEALSATTPMDRFQPYVAPPSLTRSMR
jgi:hypothetical protein